MGSKRTPGTRDSRAGGHDRSASVLTRGLSILRRLREGGYPDKAALASAAGVSPRTVQRDVRMLREHFGAPIEYDTSREGFHLTRPHWRLDGEGQGE